MTATAHAVIGGAIAASTTQNPVIGLTIAAVSHPLLDLVPHWDLGWGWREKSKLRLFLESTCDVLVGIAIAYLLFGSSAPLWYFLGCIILSIGWDVAEAPYWFFGWKFFPFGLIYKVQSQMQGKAAPPWGVVTQLIAMGVAVGIAFYLT